MIAILGAGLAGLSLAAALVRAGHREPIAIFDRKSAFEDDRTWCWWHVAGLPFEEIADAGWRRWRVTSAAHSVSGGDAARPYRHLSAATFYRAALERLASADVTLHLGMSIDTIDDRGDRVVLRSGTREFVADTVFDARAGGEHGSASPPRLVQSIRGWFVSVETPAFDPHEVTLMDFRVASAGDLRFAYVLPFSPTTALVEHAAFARAPLAHAEHDRALERYLRDHLRVTAWNVERDEAGTIPMDATRREVRPSPNVYRIGTAGGAVRASSGFAFVRIQRWSEAIAAAVATGRPIPSRAAPARYDAYDRVLLRLCRDRWHLAPEMYLSLFANVPPATLARFMSDASSPSDDARVIGTTAGAFVRGSFRNSAERGSLGQPFERARTRLANAG